MDMRSATQLTGLNVARTIVETLTLTLTLTLSLTARIVAGRVFSSTGTTAPLSTCVVRGRETATRTTNVRGTWYVAKTTAKTLETLQTRPRIAAKKLKKKILMILELGVADRGVAQATTQEILATTLSR